MAETKPRAELQFQSTPPHGERRCRWLVTLISERPCFNPRPRMGSDLATPTLGCLLQKIHVSIHAPAWGATVTLSSQSDDIVSIHAPAWGATLRAASVDRLGVTQCFNPRPRMGSDF